MREHWSRLSASADAAPGFYPRDSTSNLSPALTFVDGDRSELSFFDNQQRWRAEFRVGDSGGAALEIDDKSALTRALFGTTSDGDPTI